MISVFVAQDAIKFGAVSRNSIRERPIHLLASVNIDQSLPYTIDLTNGYGWLFDFSQLPKFSKVDVEHGITRQSVLKCA